jgi:hypothetical protein
MLIKRVVMFLDEYKHVDSAFSVSWRCVVELVDTDMLKQRSASLSKSESYTIQTIPELFIKTSGSNKQTEKCHIPEDTNFQLYRCENLKCCVCIYIYIYIYIYMHYF